MYITKMEREFALAYGVFPSFGNDLHLQSTFQIFFLFKKCKFSKLIFSKKILNSKKNIAFRTSFEIQPLLWAEQSNDDFGET